MPPRPPAARRDGLGPYKRKVRKPKDWPPRERLRPERLVWLAARPEIERLAQPWWTSLITGSGGRGSYLSHRDRKEIRGHRMREYAEACEAVALTLTKEELAVVQESAELPPWFFPAVQQVRGEQIAYRRQRRH